MKPQIRAAGYIRVSTSAKVKEGESLTTQRQQVKDFAKKGRQLTNIYADEGLSGATTGKERAMNEEVESWSAKERIDRLFYSKNRKTYNKYVL